MILIRSTMVFLLASGIASDAIAKQAQPQPVSSGPAARQTMLPNTQALFNAYVRTNKMPGNRRCIRERRSSDGLCRSGEHRRRSGRSESRSRQLMAHLFND